jgi:hypothetical protein
MIPRKLKYEEIILLIADTRMDSKGFISTDDPHTLTNLIEET